MFKTAASVEKLFIFVNLFGGSGEPGVPCLPPARVEMITMLMHLTAQSWPGEENCTDIGIASKHKCVRVNDVLYVQLILLWKIWVFKQYWNVKYVENCFCLYKAMHHWTLSVSVYMFTFTLLKLWHDDTSVVHILSETQHYVSLCHQHPSLSPCCLLPQRKQQ